MVIKGSTTAAVVVRGTPEAACVAGTRRARQAQRDWPGVRLTLAAALLVSVFGCASTGEGRPARPGESKTLESTAVVPLNDLNLVQAPIPPALLQAQRQPYGLPADLGCAALTAEVRGLDEVLGPDLDAPPTQSNPGLIERGSNALGDAASGALRSAAEGVVPFRGWVRKLSGAERYSKEVAAAIAAGTVRRGFLKGLRRGQGCPMA